MHINKRIVTATAAAVALTAALVGGGVLIGRGTAPEQAPSAVQQLGPDPVDPVVPESAAEKVRAKQLADDAAMQRSLITAVIDRKRAEGALAEGYPIVGSVGPAGCDIWVQMPDGSGWVMPALDRINRTGVRLMPSWAAVPAEHKDSQCGKPGPDPASGAFDSVAVAAAQRDGVPYAFTRADYADGCHAWILDPSGARWGIDVVDMRDRGGSVLQGDSVRDFARDKDKVKPGS